MPTLGSSAPAFPTDLNVQLELCGALLILMLLACLFHPKPFLKWDEPVDFNRWRRSLIPDQRLFFWQLKGGELPKIKFSGYKWFLPGLCVTALTLVGRWIESHQPNYLTVPPFDWATELPSAVFFGLALGVGLPWLLLYQHSLKLAAKIEIRFYPSGIIRFGAEGFWKYSAVEGWSLAEQSYEGVAFRVLSLKLRRGKIAQMGVADSIAREQVTRVFLDKGIPELGKVSVE